MKEYPIGLIPGPTSIAPQVRNAWQNNFGSSDLEPDFFDLYAQNQKLLQTLLGTKESVVITSGEAMSILWGGLKNTLKPGDTLLAVSSGLFGEGFADMARSIGVHAETVSAPYDSLPNPDDVRKAALRLRPQMITAVHCETPSGTLTPLKELGEIAREVGALFLVDFVASGGGTAVDVDTNGIDIGLLGSQKVLSLPPSLSITTLSPRAWGTIEKINFSGYEAYLPWRNVPGEPYMPYTHDWQSMAALNISLSMMMDEGMKNVFARHARVARYCRSKGQERGLELFPESEAICSPTVTAFKVPTGWTWKEWNASLRSHGLAVGGNYGCLAGKVFRIGHMGTQANDALVQKAFEIMAMVLKNKA